MTTKFTEYKGLALPIVASKVLVFFEGSFSANGLLGIHHEMALAIKNIFYRFKTQNGF